MTVPTPVHTGEQQILPPPSSRLKRNRTWLAAGVMLIALGGIAAWFVVANLSGTTPVVAMRNDVPAGAVLTGADLTTVNIGNAASLQTVPASRLTQLVGTRTNLDLKAGTLLPPAAITDKLLPPAGQSLVGLALAPGQLPGTPLQPGDIVRLVSTPKDQDDPTSTSPSVVVVGRVVSTSPIADTTKMRVDLLVSMSDSAAAAALAATNRCAIILDSSQR